ncbi:MAG: thioredoxin [Candidatus Auribacter fodinae]|jgi:thioredoxin 1|uniref:Thioredoxin n=1 Tax=Candidatus Auribacter fodinae TaxID=2093366 RepID=A0A3A4RC82_9BACT|nr:MAG: thioredoxin [Candidatus Auribacter fodinae]
MSGLIEVTAENFQEEVLESNTPVLADFAAEWCNPCKRLAPIITEVAREMTGKLKVVHIDIDTTSDVASQYDILSVPTLILFKNGEEAARNIGLIAKQNLVDFINNNL